MLCVPRVNCDFNGIITEKTLNLTPDLEMLRVPLIVSFQDNTPVIMVAEETCNFSFLFFQPCVNPDNQNIDVCCRDPNYKDPWPNMNGGKNMGGNNKANVKNYARRGN